MTWFDSVLPVGSQFEHGRDDLLIVLYNECGHWAQSSPDDGPHDAERWCARCGTVRPVGVVIARWEPYSRRPAPAPVMGRLLQLVRDTPETESGPDPDPDAGGV